MSVREIVRDYYGKVLQGSHDLQTDACCTPEAMPAWVRSVLSEIHPEIQARYYGCGLVFPEQLEGLRILDLGCGSGRDVYLLAKLVGETGEVVGVDMTPEQLEVARRHEAWQQERFGFERSNVRFLDGYIETLGDLDLEPGSFDLVVSNCVINLSPDKAAVLRGVYELLKPGGELYFSDVYADRRVPEALRQDPVLYGECLGGALYWNDFENLARRCGFADPRLVEDRPLHIDNQAQRARVGNIRFYSATWRLFKLDGLEPACEDYGQAVIYQGSIAHHPDRFVLDKHHRIETGRVFPVCGNTWRMLHETRFRPCFEFIGDGQTHYGLFPGCGGGLPFDETGGAGEAGSSGCC